MIYQDPETHARSRRQNIERDVRADRAAFATSSSRKGAERAPARASPSGRMRNGGGALATALGALAALLLGALAFEAIATVRDDGRFPPPGNVVSLDDRDLHLTCSGAGSPTVLLEAGAMAFSSAWTHVQGHLSDVTRVCAYDRAGFGWSGPRAGRHALDDVVTDLGDLLDAEGEAGPYVVVGHSLGGHYARAFAHLHAPDVLGLVLVDARHPDAATRLPGHAPETAAFAARARLAAALSPFGITRLLGDAGGSLAGLPEDARSATLARSTTSRHWTSVARELGSLDEIDVRIASQPTDDALPVLVLAAGTPSAGESEATRRAWVSMQEDLATLSNEASLHVVHGASHLGLLLHPSHAREVASHVGAFVREVAARE